jgi:hypothetical protein
VHGLAQILGSEKSGIISFETFLNETDARKLLYNLFFLFAIDCDTKADPSYSPDKITLSVKESEFRRVFGKPIVGSRGKRSVSKIRWIDNYKADAYCLHTDGQNWSPIVDLVYIL